MEALLSGGVKVAMIYGDRDMKCNWIGAENVTLHTNYPSSTAFRASGYENITNAYIRAAWSANSGASPSRAFLKATTQARPSPLHLSPVAIAIVLPPSLYVWKHLQLIFKLVSYTQPETTYQISRAQHSTWM